ncbi:MAG: GTPase Era [Clostridia bacterium]|nr:GTPase Era [Clostridia bacterium]
MKKTGFIAIVGRANVGKSTLLNAMLGEKVSIVSKKPQTTRNRIMGILTQGDNQFVFVDTPGMHKPKTTLGTYMVKAINGAVANVDAAILVADASYLPGDIEKKLIEKLRALELPIILVLNKTDLATPAQIAETITAYAALGEYASVIPLCAMKNDGVAIVLDEAEKLLPEGDFIFDEDALTDQPERQIASEVIREKILRTTDDEIPHGCAVVIEEFKESRDMVKIRAEIYCERESHKRILIGKGGATLKTIGSYAREDLEKFFGVKIYLDLWVRVKENWRDKPSAVYDFGYKPQDHE